MVSSESVFFLVRHDPIEEASRRKLLFVSNDDHLLAARYETKRVFGAHLACLINHQKIEFDGIRRKELGHRNSGSSAAPV